MSAVIKRWTIGVGDGFTVSVVKNLGWLYRHSGECERITLKYSPENEYGNPVLRANGRKTCLLMVAESRNSLRRPWRYTCTWQDIGLARDFLNRPSYAHTIRRDETEPATLRTLGHTCTPACRGR